MARFLKLEVWQKAREINKEIYLLTDKLPENEKFNIVSQLRRAATSVSTNIAERTGKLSRKDQNRYGQIAYGSLMEIWSLLYLAEDLGYISSNDRMKFELRLEEIARMLSGLLKSSI